MRAPEVLLSASLLLGACDGDNEDSGKDEQPCELVDYVPADCATDPCPAIAHADALVDLRTTVFGRVSNIGGITCDPTTAELELDGVSLGEQEVPALEPGEESIVFNDQQIFTQTDTSAPGVSHTLLIRVDGLEASSGFTPRMGVGCIVKGHLLEYVQEDQGLSIPATCDREPFVDVNTYNPYCEAITEAQSLGWVTGEQDTRDINSNGDTAETVYDTWTCANQAVAATVLMRAYGLTESTDQVCPDVDPSAWYAGAMNAVQAQTGVLADANGDCKPEEDLIRPKLEALLGAL